MPPTTVRLRARGARPVNPVRAERSRPPRAMRSPLLPATTNQTTPILAVAVLAARKTERKLIICGNASKIWGRFRVFIMGASHWLAYLPESNTLQFKSAPTGPALWYSYPFGGMPVTYSSSPQAGTYHWSFYATLLVGTTPATPTP
jgi:hypothetical protein